jgi:hypothetical protein
VLLSDNSVYDAYLSKRWIYNDIFLKTRIQTPLYSAKVVMELKYPCQLAVGLLENVA